MKNMKFATKLLLVILCVSMVSMIAVSTISYAELLNLSGFSQDVNTQLGFYASDSSKAALIKQAESYLSRLSASQAEVCNETLSHIQNEVVTMSGFMGDIYKDPDNFKGRILPLPNEVSDDFPTAKMMLAKDVAVTPEIEGEMLLVSNAEYMLGNVYANNQSLHNAYLGTDSGINFRYSKSKSYNPDYDPRTRLWFTSAHGVDGPVWLDTYVDSFENITTTCAMAFENADGAQTGVVAVDILLSTMVEDILNVRIGETGYAFLLDKDGNYLAHPRYEELDPAALNSASGEYRDTLLSMMQGNSGVRTAPIDEKEYYIAYSPLPVTGWSLGIVVEKNEVIEGAIGMKEGIDKQALEAKEQIRDTLSKVMFRFIALLCAVIVLVLICSILVSGSVTKPIRRLTDSVIEVGGGNLDQKFEVSATDEIGVLAASFNTMTGDLKKYIANLSAVTAEKERIGAELNVATRIQASMLPCIFPAFPDRAEFDIYATMLPAKEVGGDFYDFFLIDENKLAVVMADVSGKGVPAALFMVIAKTLIKNNAQYGKSPKEVFETVNNLLCENNEADMFVTAFLGYLDIPSGIFTYVNAGHNPPLLKRGDGQFDWLPAKPGFVLAGMEDIPYKQEEIRLSSGDILYMYTDGVTEAVDRENRLFTEPRLLEVANACKEQPLTGLLASVKSEIDRFADGAEQADDITMLALKVK